MQLAEPLAASWTASLALGFEARHGRTVLGTRRSEGPLVIQKPLYPEGSEVCHAIVVHPPGGIAGGDELTLSVTAAEASAALLTTPGAGKWYRSAGPWAKQKLSFDVEGRVEWLPRETIVFDGALAELDCEIRLASGARYIGWEIVCLGRTRSGERFTRGRLGLRAAIFRDQRLVWLERGMIDGGARILASPVGLGGNAVFGTFIATLDSTDLLPQCRNIAPATQLAGLLVARYLGDSTEEAFDKFIALWKLLRPAVMEREAVLPRIWST
jgi:urease accessory protein